MNYEERGERVQEALVKERGRPAQLYYISFADEDGWLGGCYVLASGPVSAVQEAHVQGCNPGGEAMVAGPVPEDYEVPPGMMNRLLSREEVRD